jgi:ABC-type amino acid transport system permease subunit
MRTFEFLGVLALIYLLLTSMLAGGMRFVESRIKYRR